MKKLAPLLFVLVSFFVNAQNCDTTLIPLQTNEGNLCDNNDTIISTFHLPYSANIVVSVENYGYPGLVGYHSDTIYNGYHTVGDLYFATKIDSPGVYNLFVRVVTDFNRCFYSTWLYTEVFPCATEVLQTNIGIEYLNEVTKKEYYTILGQKTEFKPETLLIEKLTLLNGQIYYRRIIQQ